MANFYNNSTKTLNVDNIKVDGELRIGTNVIDSDWVINMIKLEKDALARLDSDYVKNWTTETIERLVDSDFVLSVIADSDTIVGMIKTLEARVDSDYSLTISKIAEVTSRLDSDYSLVNSKFSTFSSGSSIDLDSDYAANNAKFAEVTSRLDSDYSLNTAKIAELTSRLDSDYSLTNSKIANLDSTLSARLDSDYELTNTKFAAVTSRLDSDSNKLQAVQIKLDTLKDNHDSDRADIKSELALTAKSVNGIVPDAVGNIAISLASVHTGTNDARNDYAAAEGEFWVVSGDSDTNSDGASYIYDADTSAWLPVGGSDIAANDARYINASGDIMTGYLRLHANPNNALHPATKDYVDTDISLVNSRLDSDYALTNSKFANVKERQFDWQDGFDVASSIANRSDGSSLRHGDMYYNIPDRVLWIYSDASSDWKMVDSYSSNDGDSDYALFNSKIANLDSTLSARLDSDYALTNAKFSTVPGSLNDLSDAIVVAKGGVTTTVGVGLGALIWNNEDGERNTATGVDALANVSSQTDNTALGFEAGKNNTAPNNTFIGSGSGAANTFGNDNVFVGHNAGNQNIMGTNNTFIGTGAGFNCEFGEGNIVIGSYANTSTAFSIGEIVIGNLSNSLFTVPGVGINTSAIAAPVSAAAPNGKDINFMEGDYFHAADAGLGITFIFAGTISTGISKSFTLEVVGDGGSITWPASVKWPDGTAPDAPGSGETDIYTFITRDGGTTWYGFHSGNAMA